MNLREQLLTINSTEYKPPTHKPPAKFVKGLILTDMNDSNSLYSARKLAGSIIKTKSEIDFTYYPACTSQTVEQGLEKLSYFDDPTKLKWSWPLKPGVANSELCPVTGITKQLPRSFSAEKAIANSVNHMMAMQYCIDINQPIVIMQNDAFFKRQFSLEGLKKDHELQIAKNNNNWSGDITRMPATDVKSDLYNEDLIGLSLYGGGSHTTHLEDYFAGKRGLWRIPNITNDYAEGFLADSFPNRYPRAFPSQLAYFISPWTCKKVFDKVKETGVWPVWQMLSREMVPWSLITARRVVEPQDKLYSPILTKKIIQTNE